MLWFNFILGINFIFLCFKPIIIHYQYPKTKENRIKPKLNHNISKADIACEQAVRRALAAGRKKEGELATLSLACMAGVRKGRGRELGISQSSLSLPFQTPAMQATLSLEIEFHFQFPCGSPSTELSEFCQSARSGNQRECKQTLKNTCHE